MTFIYRLRPVGDNTIDELRNEYLWFARPCCFNDRDRDSNISAFISHNEGLQTALRRNLNNVGMTELAQKSQYIGICCFTRSLPKNRKVWSKFPNGLDSVCVVYNKEILKTYFEKIGKYNPFVDVEYIPNPLTLEQENGITYIRETLDESNYILHNVNGELCYDFNHGLDKISKLLLTRISNEYDEQHEVRVFLGGIHIPSYDENLKGYEFFISNESIVSIIIPRRISNNYPEFINTLKSIDTIKDKLIFK